MADDQNADRRRFIRFPADPGTVAEIDIYTEKSDGQFQGQMSALILNESFRGCGLATLLTDKLQVGDTCKVKVGRLQPLRAQVKWRAQIDPQVIKVGFEFLE